jgi:hypothetical protein
MDAVERVMTVWLGVDTGTCMWEMERPAKKMSQS